VESSVTVARASTPCHPSMPLAVTPMATPCRLPAHLGQARPRHGAHILRVCHRLRHRAALRLSSAPEKSHAIPVEQCSIQTAARPAKRSVQP
jgi:hypothetical protein